MKKKTKSNIFFLIVFIVFFIVQFMLNNYLSSKQLAIYKDSYPGTCIDVNGACMRVYEQGEGEETIILMSDYGVATPITDYQPLLDELSKKYHVVVPENFGYGLSDVTDAPRDISSITNDLHSALSQMGIDKYILLSSGFSNVYATYYINKYRSEVSALVGLDPTIIETSTKTRFKARNELDSFLTTSGLTRIASVIFPTLFTPTDYRKSSTFSKEERQMISNFSIMNYSNSNLVQEGKQYKKSLEAIEFVRLPKDFPILYISSVTRSGAVNELNIKRADALKDYTNAEAIDVLNYNKLHWSAYRDISVAMRNFFDNLKIKEVE